MILESYKQHIKEREKLGIPPIPLSAEQVKAISELVYNPLKGYEEFILKLLKEHVPPGVDPAALEKAKLLRSIAIGECFSSIISPIDAVQMLGMMRGGYNIETLIELLEDEALGDAAVHALSNIILIFGFFERIKELSYRNKRARKLLESWAKGEWFTRKPKLPETLKVIIFRIHGEVNTDDLSPSSRAGSRSDIPLHALYMLEKRYPNAIDELRQLKQRGYPIAFTSDVVGTGSSRKSAMNSLIWWIGKDIPGVPNKRRGGIIIGKQIAPIFFNTARDSGAIPITCDMSKLETGMLVTVDMAKGKIIDENNKIITSFKLEPETLADEYRAGGRLLLLIGKELTMKAQEALKVKYEIFHIPKIPVSKAGFTLAQKIVGKACGLKGVYPTQSVLPRITTVGSQDTTGPMTSDELKELACIEFQAPLVLQSFCHTAAYPTQEDKIMHRTLTEFFRSRGGVTLKPGDGIIHSWLNRMLLPDTVGTGGDSHTRFPIGISFPAGSGLVAFAAAFGKMPIDMPESVLVKFKGKPRKGIFLRDIVNALPYFASKQGKLIKNKKNVFNGRIIEIEFDQLELTVEQAFELTNSSAERSAEAAVISLSEKQVADFLRTNIAILKSLLKEYVSASLEKRIKEMEAWLASPELLKADENAEYADIIEINLSEIHEPLLACPNDPDNIKPLSEVAGEKIHEVFIGSCMLSIEHYQHAAKILKGRKIRTKLWIAPTTKLVEKQLKEKGEFVIFKEAGARLEIPGCSLCMGNQARVENNSVVFSTSTRNFDNRMGNNAKVYLGSAQLAAIVSILGRIPTLEEYFEYLNSFLSS